jgi:hypothetical protein
MDSGPSPAKANSDIKTPFLGKDERHSGPTDLAPVNPTHPITRAGCLSRMTFQWEDEIIKRNALYPFEQNMHYDLPEADQTVLNLKIFRENFQLFKSLSKTIWRTFRGLFSLSIFLAFICVLCQNIGALQIYWVVSSLMTTKTPDGQADTGINISLFIFNIVMILVVQLIAVAAEQYNIITMSRLSVKIRNVVTSLIIEKAYKFSLLNSKNYNEGGLINFVQVDAVKFEKSIFQLTAFLFCCLDCMCACF